MRALPFTLLCLAALTTALTAQDRHAPKPPRRPSLPSGSDTCDANAYYRYGVMILRGDPSSAAAAFYWAERLAPTTAVAYYGERIARLIDDPYLLRGYVEDNRHVLESAEARRLDSLQLRALTLDPFFPQRLDENLILAYYTNEIHDQLRAQGEEVSDLEIEVYIRRALDGADMETRAWLAFGRGNYQEAAGLWAGQLRHDRKNAHLRAWRARAVFLSGELDSARVELDSALATSRRADAEKLRFVYDSKALWEYQIGRIHEMQGRDSSAREAYQRALVEDLSFNPAHVRLADIALRWRDTTAALAELQRAVQAREDDFSARLMLGTVFAARGAADSATAHLRRAAEIEPWVAQTHLLLGDVRRDAGDRDGAAVEYRRFLALASQADPGVVAARARLAALTPPPQ